MKPEDTIRPFIVPEDIKALCDFASKSVKCEAHPDLDISDQEIKQMDALRRLLSRIRPLAKVAQKIIPLCLCADSLIGLV